MDGIVCDEELHYFDAYTVEWRTNREHLDAISTSSGDAIDLFVDAIML